MRSEHPLGKAIIEFAKERGISPREPERFDYTPGLGITAVVAGETLLVGNRRFLAHHRIEFPSNLAEADGASEILVARDGRFLGAIGVADTIRPEARQAVQMLKRMKIRTVVLTGDTQSVAASVARKLGIDEVEADLLPEMKLGRIKSLVAGGRVVAMVGDGINDAPALAQANVGVAMGSGTDVARESADVVLLGNDLTKFVETLVIARWMRRIIWQNFVGTIVVDLAGMALAALGLLHPTVAAFIHVASEMTFILNSARLLPRAEPVSKELTADAREETLAKAA